MKVLRTISIDSDLWEAITQLAREENKPISWLIEELLVEKIVEKGMIGK